MDTREAYHETILENIEYGTLIQDRRLDRDRLNEIVELLADMACSARQTICIPGGDLPVEVVKSRLLKLDSSHIQYVLGCVASNVTYARNIKKYLPAALFNAPATIGNYYSALINYDLYGSGERRQPMREEVIQKTIALSIQAIRLTASVLRKVLKKLLKSGRNKLAQPNRGKQTLWQLTKYNIGVSNIKITNDNIKAFEYTAKKYGTDFTLKRDTSTHPPRCLVFLKGWDADALTAAFKESSARNLDHEKKSSVHELLFQMQGKAKQHRQREKVKTRDRGQGL